jgi:oligopeptide transport system ATP-binding protein
MYLGRIVEIASRDELFGDPLHPYTRALLSAVPVADPEAEAKRERQVLPGEVPSTLCPPSGCRFHPRCPQAMHICRQESPQLTGMGGGHAVACYLHRAVNPIVVQGGEAIAA